jgi:hypothetical protein
VHAGRRTGCRPHVGYSLIVTLGVGAPVVAYFTFGDRSEAILEDMRTWLARNNAAIMSVIFMIVGAPLVGKGIAGCRSIGVSRTRADV